MSSTLHGVCVTKYLSALKHQAMCVRTSLHTYIWQLCSKSQRIIYYVQLSAQKYLPGARLV